MGRQDYSFISAPDVRTVADLSYGVTRHHWEQIKIKVSKTIYWPLVRCSKCHGRMSKSGKHRIMCAGYVV